VDYAPTIAAWAGTVPSAPVDGLSFAKLLKNPAAPWRSGLLLEALGEDRTSPFHVRNFLAIRTRKYAYAEYMNGESELYDLSEDPDELDNKLDDRSYAPILENLRQDLDGLRDRARLSLTVTVTPSTVSPGQNVTYLAKISNTGSVPAASLILQDSLPAEMSFVSCATTGKGVCQNKQRLTRVSFKVLQPGALATAHLVMKVGTSTSPGSHVSNSLSVSSFTSHELTPEDNSDTAQIKVD
jgi:uncharacterized repeat protein (TIGR01451 family)